MKKSRRLAEADAAPNAAAGSAPTVTGGFITMWLLARQEPTKLQSSSKKARTTILRHLRAMMLDARDVLLLISSCVHRRRYVAVALSVKKPRFNKPWQRG